MSRHENQLAQICYRQTPAILQTSDAQGYLIDVSDQWLEALGYDREEVIGQKVTHFLTEAGKIHFESEIIPLLKANKKVREVTCEFLKKEGDLLEAVVSATAEQDEAGNIIRIFSVLSYVFEKGQAERTLAEERNLLRTLIDHLPVHIYVKDTEGKYIIGNKAVAKEIGLSSPQELIGKTDFDLYPMQLAAQYHAEEQAILNAQKSIINQEEMRQDEKGDKKWFSITKVPLQDSSDQVIGLVGVDRDITQRKLAENALAHRVTELETVAEVNAAVSTILETKELLQTVTDLTRDRFNLFQVYIFLIDEIEEVLRLAAGAGEGGRMLVEEKLNFSLHDETSKFAQIIQTKQGLIVNDTHKEADFWGNTAQFLPDVRSEMAVPIMVKGNVLGILQVQSNTINRFTEEDVRIKTVLAAQVAVALENTRLFEEAHRQASKIEDHAQRLILLNDMGTAINQSTSTPEEVLDIASSKISLIVEAARVSLTLLDEADETLEVFVLDGLAGAIPTGVHLPLEKTSVGFVVREKETIVVPDIQQREEIDLQQLAAQGVRSVISVPMLVGDKVIGTLNAARKQSHTFSQKDVPLFTQLASLLATALENRRLFLQTQNTLDKTERLYAASRDITFARNEQEVVAALLKHITLEELDRVLVALISEMEEQKIIKVKGIWDRTEGTEIKFSGRTFKPEQIPLINHLDSEDILLIENFETSPEVDEVTRATFKHLGVISAAIIPISAGKRLLGWLLLETLEQPRKFTMEEIRPFLALTGQAGVTLENVRLFEETHKSALEIKEQAHRLSLLNKMGTALNAATDINEVFKIAIFRTSSILNAQWASIALLDSAGNEFKVFALEGGRRIRPVEQTLRVENSLFGQVVKDQEMMIVPDLQQTTWTNTEQLTQQGLNSALSTPLIAGGLTLGTLNVAGEQKDAFTAQDQSLLLQIASLVATAIENRRLLEQAHSRVRRERILREVTARVRDSVDIDAVIRTTAQEVGRALGRPAFAYLGKPNDRSSSQQSVELISKEDDV